MAVLGRGSVVARGGAAALLAVLMGVTVGAQSPSAIPVASPGATSAPVVAATTPLSVTWTNVPSMSDPQVGAAAYGMGTLADGSLVLLGTSLVDYSDEYQTAAAWSTTDGATWTPLKLKARQLSATFALGTIGDAAVITGMDPDGAGAVWLERKGRFGAPKGMDGLINALLPHAEALLGVGIDPTGAPAVFATTDGARWEATQLAPSGRALAIAETAAGRLVVAGATMTADGQMAPTVWTSTDATTWTAVPLDGPAGRWQTPVLLATPAGLALAFSVSTDADPTTHLWTSTDGATWTDAALEAGGPLRIGLVVDGQALFIGEGRRVHGVPGDTWISTPDATFDGFHPRAVGRLADGRLVVAGDHDDMALRSLLSVWTGTVGS